MIEGLMTQFLGSGEAAGLLGQLQQQGLTAPQAQGALTATAEGTAAAVQADGIGALTGGGLASAVGSMLGGGGLAGGLGAMMGGGGSTGLPAGLVDTVAATVAAKTGLSAEMAKTAVNMVLPQVIAFVKAKMA